MTKHVIRDSDLPGNVLPVGPVVAKYQQPVSVGGIDQVAGELRCAVTPREQLVAGAGLHNHIARALALQLQHQAVLIGDARNIAPQLVGGAAHVIEPFAFAQVGRIDAAVPDLAKRGQQRALAPAEKEDVFHSLLEVADTKRDLVFGTRIPHNLSGMLQKY